MCIRDRKERVDYFKIVVYGKSNETSSIPISCSFIVTSHYSGISNTRIEIPATITWSFLFMLLTASGSLKILLRLLYDHPPDYINPPML